MKKNFRLKYIFIIILVISVIVFILTYNNSNELNFQWEYEDSKPVSEIIASTANIFFIDDNFEVVALDASNGKLNWKKNLDINSLGNLEMKLEGNRLIINSKNIENDHKLYILNKDFGEILFEKYLGQFENFHNAFYFEGFLYYVVNQNNQYSINKLDISNFRETRIRSFENKVLFARYFDEHLAYVIEEIEDGKPFYKVQVLHLEDLDSTGVPEIYSVSLSAKPRKVLLNNNFYYVALDNGDIYGIDILGDKKEWINSTGQIIENMYFFNNVLFTTTSNNNFYGFDPVSGDALVSNTLSSEIDPSSLTFIVKNNTLFTTSENRLQAIDLKSGDEIFEYSIKDIHKRKFALDAKFLYITTEDGLEKLELN